MEKEYLGLRSVVIEEYGKKENWFKYYKNLFKRFENKRKIIINKFFFL